MRSRDREIGGRAGPFFTPISRCSVREFAAIAQDRMVMLLCDFHIHTTYSDGVLPLPEVVDLFGQSGHDVIAITDHIVNEDSGLGKVAHRIGNSLDPESWKRYADEIDCEAERAWSTYGMLVLRGA